MERTNILNVVLFVVVLAIRPRVFSLPIPIPMPPFVPRPLCASQFALVNHACALLPFNPGPPSPPLPPGPGPIPPSPSPTSPDDPDDPEEHRHGHGHGHRHHDRHRRHGDGEESPIEVECCRWLQAVDAECVCDLLVRLPAFLSRPVHQYTVSVDGICSVTYPCASRLQP